MEFPIAARRIPDVLCPAERDRWKPPGGSHEGAPAIIHPWSFPFRAVPHVEGSSFLSALQPPKPVGPRTPGRITFFTPPAFPLLSVPLLIR